MKRRIFVKTGTMDCRKVGRPLAQAGLSFSNLNRLLRCSLSERRAICYAALAFKPNMRYHILLKFQSAIGSPQIPLMEFVWEGEKNSHPALRMCALNCFSFCAQGPANRVGGTQKSGIMAPSLTVPVNRPFFASSIV